MRGAAGLPASVLEVVTSSPLPVALLELPSEVLLAASDPALELLGQRPSAVGRSVEDFLTDDPTEGLDLLMRGQVSGYETTRRVRVDSEEKEIRVWLRSLSQEPPVHHALTVLSLPQAVRAALRDVQLDDRHRLPVIGTVNTNLAIDRVSSEVEELLGMPASSILHSPLLHFAEGDAAGQLLLAVAQATMNGRGMSTRIPLRRTDGSAIVTDVAILPLTPTPSFAFVLTDPTANDRGSPPSSTSSLLTALAQMLDCLETSKSVADCAPVAGLEQLSTREFHVVGMLMQGDRVPAIARAMFLSPSTVRNHLSSVFRKLGVGSQQELISLLRQKSAASPLVRTLRLDGEPIRAPRLQA